MALLPFRPILALPSRQSSSLFLPKASTGRRQSLLGYTGHAHGEIHGAFLLRQPKKMIKITPQASQGDISESTKEPASSKIAQAIDDESSSSPPLLTILAGVVVFVFFIWGFGSLALGIIRLFVR